MAGLDFQFLTQENFEREAVFSAAFANQFARAVRHTKEIDGKLTEPLKECAREKKCGLAELFEILSDFCADTPKPVVLLIDEVDQASNF